MTEETFDNVCLRHPDTASNLGCGRCGDLICPQCMVQSPVGARCPDCASIGQAAIFRSTSTELSKTILYAIGGAVAFGFAFAVLVFIIWIIPFGHQVGGVVAAMVSGLGGVPVGEFVRRAGGYKLDSRLRIIAALTMFSAWVIGIAIATNLFGVWGGIFQNLMAFFGLGIGIYIAMNRVRP